MTGFARSHRQPAAGADPAHETIVYVDGVFDVLHPGHLAFMRKARALGGLRPFLLVGVISDEDARWKREPVMSHAERLEMIAHCDLVDGMVASPPLVLTAEFLEALSIDIVAHGDDDRQETFFEAAIAAGIMRYVPYSEGISTTAIIGRVLERARPPPT